MKGKPQAVIFDMDGLLIDSEIIWQKVERDLLARHGCRFDEEIAKTHLGMRIDEACRVMLEAYGIDGDPDGFARELVDALLVEFEVSLAPLPGAQASLAEAARLDLPVAIASSSPTRVIRQALAQLGWENAVDRISAGDEVERGKPAPDIYLLAAERLGVEPAGCIALEDSVNGARAARAAGMFCIAVPNPFYEPVDFEGIADRVLPSLETLSFERLLP